MPNNKKVLSTTEKATKALLAAGVALQKVSADLATNITVNESVIEEIVLGQITLAGLAEETALAVRKEKINLDLQVQENAEGVLHDLLHKNDLANISLVDLADLTDKFHEAKSDNSSDINKAVAIAVVKANAAADIELTKAQSDHAVESAKTTADLAAAKAEITFMNRSIATLEATIQSEREARVSIAEAEANKQGVTVNNGK